MQSWGGQHVDGGPVWEALLLLPIGHFHLEGGHCGDTGQLSSSPLINSVTLGKIQIMASRRPTFLSSKMGTIINTKAYVGIMNSFSFSLGILKA